MIETSRRVALATAAAAWLALAGCASTSTPLSVTDTTAALPQLTTLDRLITHAGVADTLKGPGPFTLFAPSDDAFEAVPAKTMDELAKEQDRLRAVLTRHVVPGTLMAADVKMGNVKTVNGAQVGLSKAGALIAFDEAVVTQADVPATNGVMHVIDKMIVPPAPRR